MRLMRELGGRRRLAVTLAAISCTGAAGAATAPAAGAAVPHLVQPGESLWSISAANGFTTASVAAYNGLSEDAMLIAGQTIQIPTVNEGAAALAAAPTTAPAETATVPVTDTYGLATVSGPQGAVPLDPAAAASFEQMRADALAQFGIDLYPDGTLSGFRTYAQQAYLYDLFVTGQGAPANPPGTSSHEFGTALDLADPAMRDVVDQIGGAYGWYGIASEWWHIQYGG